MVIKMQMPGKAIVDIVPCDSNKRNSEGAFITLKNNDILFVYSRYRDSGSGDDCAADLYGIVSTNRGESFGSPFPVLLCENANADNLMSVSLLRLNNGDIGMFYLKKNNDGHQCIPFLICSSDEGKTWSKPIRCIENTGYFVLNNDRVIRLESGRLIMTLSKHEINDNFGPGRVYICVSDDDGKSWKTTAESIGIPVSVRCDKNADSAMEPGAVQLKNGMVWCYIRTYLGRQYEMFSYDNGDNWTTPNPSRFTSPDSPMCVKKLSDNKLLAVWNPIPDYNGRITMANGIWTGGRTSMLLAIMDENANEILNTLEIENDENSGFCYCAVHELSDGSILLGYCAGSAKDGGCLNRLRIRKINKEEFSQ